MDRESPARGLTWVKVLKPLPVILAGRYDLFKQTADRGSSNECNSHNPHLFTGGPNKVNSPKCCPTGPQYPSPRRRRSRSSRSQRQCLKSSTAEKEWIYGKGFARKRNLKLDLFGNEVGHKYYFATFEYFRVGRHKSWHKSRDPHFSLAYKWKTLFNTFKTIHFCSSGWNLTI